jgi:hypothetical protein
MVSQALFTGKIVCLDGDTNEIVAEVDYTPISTRVMSPLWSSASTCDPLKDLKTAMRLVSGACGQSADLIVMGEDASDAFENADKVLAAYDKQHIAPGTITPQLAEYKITLLGNYRGLPLHASESQCTDVDGTSKYFVPADKCWSPRRDYKALWLIPESFRWMKKHPRPALDTPSSALAIPRP